MIKFKKPSTGRFHEPATIDRVEGILADIRELLYISVAAESGFHHDALVNDFNDRRVEKT